MNYRWVVLFSALGCLWLTAAADPIASGYVIQTVAGSDFVGDGGPATAALLSQAEGVATDGSGAIYIADAADNRIRKIAPDGTIETIAGTGTPGFSGDGGAATAALLSHPYGIATDTHGNLFIADLGNARVRKISPDGTIQTVAGGGSIAPGASGDGSAATQMKLRQPRNVAVDPDGTLYISDFGANRVFQVSPNGILTTVAGTGTAGLSGDGASAQLAQLNAPAGLASDGNGSLYIADSGNNRIRKVFHDEISTVFNITEPTGLAMGPTGAVYVASSTYFGTTSNAVSGIFSTLDVALDAAGNAYLTSGEIVRKLTNKGTVTTIAGTGAPPSFSGDGGPATIARLNAPSAVAVDAAGNSYLADTANNRIRKVTAAGVISTIAGTGVAGNKNDNGPAVSAQLNAPTGIAIDALDNLFVADSGNNAIRKITPGGMISTVVAQLNNPEGVAVDQNGSIYIADTGNNRVIEATGSGAITPLALATKPVALTVDGSGDVFVSESTRISKLLPSGSISIVLDGLNAPAGLAVTASGDVLFAETGLNVIRHLSAAGTVSAIAGTGAAGFAGDGGPASVALLNSPFGLTVDGNGVIWVADQGNNRVRTLNPVAPPAGNVSAPLTVVNAATMLPGSVAPNEIVAIFGSGFDPSNTQILFDGVPATVFYTSSTQINALAPANLVPGSSTNITASANGAQVGAVAVPVVTAAPGIFTTANGTGPAAANNEDGSINSASNPADRGSVMSLYATGAGVAQAATVSIGGYSADVLYAGPAPGFQGLTQINVAVPRGFLSPGIQPIILSIAGASSQSGVTIAVR